VQTDSNQFLSRLIQLSQLRLERERPLRAVPKKPERFAYATAAKGYGYRMALMGFDFTNLEEKRRKFQWWLEQQGVDAQTAYSEAMRLEHSWEFAAHNQGKAYMDALDPWLGALDMTPGSVGLRLYDKYREVKGYAFCPTGEGGGIDNSCSPTGEPGKGKEGEDYRGLHTAPMRDSGSPLHDLANTYPEDIYGPKAAEYYGHYGGGNPMDRQSIAIIQSMHGKPNATVAIYRAVPKNLTNEELITDYEKQKAYILKHGKVPPGVQQVGKNSSAHYDFISKEMDRLKALPIQEKQKIAINPGDWVTINREYAKEHGDSQFDGKYRILMKRVSARDIFTNGDSIHEWGYDPQPRIKAPPRHSKQQFSAAESRTDFQQIKDIYNKDAVRLSIALRTYITAARDALTQLVERQAQQGPLSAEFAQSVRVNTGHEFQNAVEAYLMDVWRRNRDAAIAELPEKLRVKLQGMKRYSFPDHEGRPGQVGGSQPRGEGGSSSKPYLTGWHGTLASRLPDIIKEGVVTGKFKNWEGYTRIGELEHEVFIAQNPATAYKFGELAAQVKGEPEFAIVEVHIPKSETIANDKRTPGSWTVAQIKPEWLVKAQVYSRREGDFMKLASTTDMLKPIREIKIHEQIDDYIVVYLPLPVAKLENLKSYAVAFRPDIAGNYFHNRALLIKGIVDDELTRDAKFSIFETLKGGRTMNEAMGDLRSIFEPWIGDPTKIEPSGISQTEADVLKPYRLENIIRTESTTAIAQGRAAVADAAADFVVGFEHSSILDDRTTEVCQLADGITFKKDDPRAIKLTPPLHFNCRSIDTFVTSDDDVEWTSEEDLDAVVRLIQPEFK